MSMKYPDLPDGYENATRTKPIEFAPHYSGRRFLVRERHACPECGPAIEVFGYGLEHICWAENVETATMIADSLELAAASNELDSALQEKLRIAKRLRTRIMNSVYPPDAKPYSDGLVDGIKSAIAEVHSKTSNDQTHKGERMTKPTIIAFGYHVDKLIPRQLVQGSWELHRLREGGWDYMGTVGQDVFDRTVDQANELAEVIDQVATSADKPE